MARRISQGPGAPDGRHAGEDSKADLYRRAQEQDIPGRSKMNKEQLKRALEDR